jgi:hypothetical protein
VGQDRHLDGAAVRFRRNELSGDAAHCRKCCSRRLLCSPDGFDHGNATAGAPTSAGRPASLADRTALSTLGDLKGYGFASHSRTASGERRISGHMGI